jgi:hypothetical protein
MDVFKRAQIFDSQEAAKPPFGLDGSSDSRKDTSSNLERTIPQGIERVQTEPASKAPIPIKSEEIRPDIDATSDLKESSNTNPWGNITSSYPSSATPRKRDKFKDLFKKKKT